MLMNFFRSGSQVLGCSAMLFAAANVAQAETLIGLRFDNSLIFFDSATPGSTSAPLGITGLQPDEIIYDIDIRPANNTLYGLGSSGRIYTINDNTGAASPIPNLFADPTDLTAPYTGLDNSLRFGIDFNPVPDRLRVVSSNGQNLRINVGTGGVITDTNLNGAANQAVSVAYTNNDTDPGTGTTLFYIDSGSPGTVYNTTNPNGGVLTLVGSLNSNTNLNTGFDISGSGAVFASLTDPVSLTSSLYNVNLGTGNATLIGAIGSPLSIRGIAARPIPEPATFVFAGIGLAGAGWWYSRKRKQAV
jgi:hypothetical protein